LLLRKILLIANTQFYIICYFLFAAAQEGVRLRGQGAPLQ
jgi:hypothetical protein